MNLCALLRQLSMRARHHVDGALQGNGTLLDRAIAKLVELLQDEGSHEKLVSWIDGINATLDDDTWKRVKQWAQLLLTGLGEHEAQLMERLGEQPCNQPALIGLSKQVLISCVTQFLAGGVDVGSLDPFVISPIGYNIPITLQDIRLTRFRDFGAEDYANIITFSEDHIDLELPVLDMPIPRVITVTLRNIACTLSVGGYKVEGKLSTYEGKAALDVENATIQATLALDGATGTPVLNCCNIKEFTMGSISLDWNSITGQPSRWNPPAWAAWNTVFKAIQGAPRLVSGAMKPHLQDAVVAMLDTHKEFLNDNIIANVWRLRSGSSGAAGEDLSHGPAQRGQKRAHSNLDP